MTLTDARACKEGGFVMDPVTRRPHKIQTLHLTGTPMARLSGVRKGAWVRLEAYELVPEGKTWNAAKGGWVDAA